MSRSGPPRGFSSRALTLADLDTAFAVYAESELADSGDLMLEREDIESDWERPSFDLSSQSVGVFDGARLVAAAEVFRGRRAEAAVATDYLGRGIGTWLAAWTEDLARREGSALVGQSLVDGCAGDRLLRARGYRQMWTSWILQVPTDSPIAPQPLPPGYAVRTFVPGQDEQVAYRLIEDAFNEWPDRAPQSYADWHPRVVGRRGFQPWQIRLAVDAEGTPVGVACTLLDAEGNTHVDQLAVRRDHRGRGLARALLVDAFENGRSRGATRSDLGTDSRTGSLGLYLRVGMHVTQTWQHLALDLC
jgi:mycothiol synthase